MLKTDAPRQQDTAKKSVLLVDDHPIVRKGLMMLINTQPDWEVCGEAAGMSEGMSLFFEKHPEFVIVDLSLENGSGLELIRAIVKVEPKTKILVHSLHDENLFAERALCAGAKGYINKMEATNRIVDALKCLQAGNLYLSDKMKERMLSRSVGAVPAGTDHSPVDRLSDREFEVFELIGKGMAVKEIAEKLYLSPKTIETYRDSIKTKLDLKNSRQVVQYAIQWVLEEM